MQRDAEKSEDCEGRAMITPALREALTKQGDRLPRAGKPRTGLSQDTKKSRVVSVGLGSQHVFVRTWALGPEKNNVGGSSYLAQFQTLSLCGPGPCDRCFWVYNELEPRGSRTAWERPPCRR